MLVELNVAVVSATTLHVQGTVQWPRPGDEQRPATNNSSCCDPSAGDDGIRSSVLLSAVAVSPSATSFAAAVTTTPLDRWTAVPVRHLVPLEAVQSTAATQIVRFRLLVRFSGLPCQWICNEGASDSLPHLSESDCDGTDVLMVRIADASQSFPEPFAVSARCLWYFLDCSDALAADAVEFSREVLRAHGSQSSTAAAGLIVYCCGSALLAGRTSLRIPYSMVRRAFCPTMMACDAAVGMWCRWRIAAAVLQAVGRGRTLVSCMRMTLSLAAQPSEQPALWTALRRNVWAAGRWDCWGRAAWETCVGVFHSATSGAAPSYSVLAACELPSVAVRSRVSAEQSSTLQTQTPLCWTTVAVAVAPTAGAAVSSRPWRTVVPVIVLVVAVVGVTSNRAEAVSAQRACLHLRCDFDSQEVRRSEQSVHVFLDGVPGDATLVSLVLHRESWSPHIVVRCDNGSVSHDVRGCVVAYVHRHCNSSMMSLVDGCLL